MAGYKKDGLKHQAMQELASGKSVASGHRKKLVKYAKPGMQKSRNALVKLLDKLTSDCVKHMNHYTCQRCGKKYDRGSRALHCSHYFSRRYMGTRFELANLDCLCYGCHRMVEGSKQSGDWYSAYMLKKLGERGYQYLEMKAHTITRFTLKDLELMIDLMKSNV
jgi:hypothetical protein